MPRIYSSHLRIHNKIKWVSESGTSEHKHTQINEGQSIITYQLTTQSGSRGEKHTPLWGVWINEREKKNRWAVWHARDEYAGGCEYDGGREGVRWGEASSSWWQRCVTAAMLPCSRMTSCPHLSLAERTSRPSQKWAQQYVSGNEACP